MKISITLAGIVFSVMVFALFNTSPVFADPQVNMYSGDFYHVHGYKRNHRGSRYGRGYKKRFKYGKRHSYGYKRKPYRRKYRYHSYDSHYGGSYRKHRHKYKRRYYGGRYGYGTGYKGSYGFGIYYGRPYSDIGGYYNNRKSCHPVSKYTYDDYGNRHKIGGTMCYDKYGEGYIVEGSRYKIW